MQPTRSRQVGASGGWNSRQAAIAGILCATCALLTLLLSIRPLDTMMEAFVLKNTGGVEVHVLRRGAIIQRLLVPHARGTVADIVLGFDTEEPYKVRMRVGLAATAREWC